MAPQITFAEAAATPPGVAEAANWGEVCLLDDHTMVLHRDGTYTVSQHRVTMLCGDQNLAAWDETAVAYDRSRWRPMVRSARAYLPDGGTFDAVRTIQRLARTAPDAPTNVITISFPHLRPGTVVDWEFQEDSFQPNLAVCGVWGEFFLQTPIPCRRRRITVGIAPPFTATIRAHNGAHSPAEFDVGGYRVYQWDLRNVEALEVDAWVPAARDFASWLDVSTVNSWRPIASYYQRELQAEAQPPDEVKHLVRELTQNAETESEKVFRIHQFLARDVRYGRHPQESGMTTSREMGRMIVDLRGDCKDKSAMLVSMLGEVAIPACIAVVLTNDNGFKFFLPSSRFNHAIVMASVDGKELWMDPAAGPYTYGDMPSSDQGVQALLLGERAARVTEVPPPQPSDHRIDRVAGGCLEADGTYRFETLVTAAGDRAAELRDALRFRAEEHRQSLMTQSVAGDHVGAHVDDVMIDNIDDLRHPPRYKYRITLPAWGRRIESLLIVRMPWFEPFEMAGLFAVHARPVPLAAPRVGSVTEFHTIEMPAGFAGYGLPLERSERCPWATYSCQVYADAARLHCERRVQFLGGIVAPVDFGEFKRFWEACVRWDGEDIVLVQNSSPLACVSG